MFSPHSLLFCLNQGLLVSFSLLEPAVTEIFSYFTILTFHNKNTKYCGVSGGKIYLSPISSSGRASHLSISIHVLDPEPAQSKAYCHLPRVLLLGGMGNRIMCVPLCHLLLVRLNYVITH